MRDNGMRWSVIRSLCIESKIKMPIFTQTANESDFYKKFHIEYRMMRYYLSINQEKVMSILNIHKRYVLQYSRESIFDMWVSPQAVVAPVNAIEVDPQVGGLFKLIVDGEPKSHMIGKFLEFDRPAKLVYTWEWNQNGEVSQVQVVFNAVAANATEVIIDHTGFKKVSSQETHDQGWDSYVAGLKQRLENEA